MSEQQSESKGLFQMDSLIYDWNQMPPFTSQFDPQQLLELNDEALRDGLQSPCSGYLLYPF